MNEDDYETLAGMILYYHGSIPDLVIKVLKVSTARLELISMKVD